MIIVFIVIIVIIVLIVIIVNCELSRLCENNDRSSGSVGGGGQIPSNQLSMISIFIPHNHRREYYAVNVITGSKILTSLSFRFYFTSSEHYCWTHPHSNYSGNNRRSSFGNFWNLLFDVVAQDGAGT